MNINDSILAKSGLAEHTLMTDGNPITFNIWIYVAIIEFCIIAYFILSKIKKKKTRRSWFKEEALAQDIDFNNIINSSFNASPLYNSLKIRCHPDRFTLDKNKFDYANKLYQEITENKNNLKKLEELKEKAILNLNIKF